MLKFEAAILCDCVFVLVRALLMEDDDIFCMQMSVWEQPLAMICDGGKMRGSPVGGAASPDKL